MNENTVNTGNETIEVVEEVTVKPTETVEVTPEVVKPQTKNEILRGISKEFGINAFNPEEIKKTLEEVNAYKAEQVRLEELNKTELQKAQELVNAANEKETALNEKIVTLETITKLQGKNVNKDYQEDIIDLLKARGLEASDENIDKIIAKNPSWVNEKKEFTQMGANQATVKKEATAQMKTMRSVVSGGRR